MVNVRKEVYQAFRNRYAIGCFNICNLENFQAVLSASRRTKSSVFMATSNRTIEYMGIENIMNLSRGLKGSKVMLHLDHGDYRNAIKCINYGYPSVMFDGSMYNFKKNVNLTKKVADYAHKNKVFVEGEIGALQKDGLTNPEEALNFVKQTGVDMLAISIGNEHGYYKYMPTIDIKRLMEIKDTVRIPLVLHGSSGIDDDTIRAVLKYNIAKVNVDTDLRWAYSYAISDFMRRHSLNKLDKDTFDIRNYSGLARNAFENKVVEKIKLFHP